MSHAISNYKNNQITPKSKMYLLLFLKNKNAPTDRSSLVIFRTSFPNISIKPRCQRDTAYFFGRFYFSVVLVLKSVQCCGVACVLRDLYSVCVPSRVKIHTETGVNVLKCLHRCCFMPDRSQKQAEFFL